MFVMSASMFFVHIYVRDRLLFHCCVHIHVHVQWDVDVDRGGTWTWAWAP
jgi:hypothetical protein